MDSGPSSDCYRVGKLMVLGSCCSGPGCVCLCGVQHLGSKAFGVWALGLRADGCPLGKTSALLFKLFSET